MADNNDNNTTNQPPSSLPNVIDLEDAMGNLGLSDGAASDAQLQRLMSNLVLSNPQHPVNIIETVTPEADTDNQDEAFRKMVYNYLQMRGHFRSYNWGRYETDYRIHPTGLILNLHMQIAMAEAQAQVSWAQPRPRLTPREIELTLGLLNKWCRPRFAQSLRQFGYRIQIRFDIGEGGSIIITIDDEKETHPQAIHTTRCHIYRSLAAGPTT